MLVSAVCCSILLAATQLFFFLFFLLKKERSHKDYVNITFLKTHLLTTRRNLCTRPYTLSTGVLYTGLHGGNVAKVMGTFLFHFLSFFSLLFPRFFLSFLLSSLVCTWWCALRVHVSVVQAPACALRVSDAFSMWCVSDRFHLSLFYFLSLSLSLSSKAYIEELINEHMECTKKGHGHKSRLKQLVPTIGTFHTPLMLQAAFEE